MSETGKSATQLARMRQVVDGAPAPQPAPGTAHATRRQPWQETPAERARRIAAEMDPIAEGAVRKTVYTLGHQRMPWDEFLRRLLRWEIDTVVDVRQTPAGGKPHFAREALEARLEELGIAYVRDEALTGRFEPKPKFKEGLARLVKLVSERRAVCLLGVMEDPRTCQRWQIVGRALEALGLHVVNIRSRMLY